MAHNRRYRELLSRRRFVELSGVSGAAALAGCGGSGDGADGESSGDGSTGTDGSGSSSDGESTSDDGDGGTQVHDVRHVSQTNQVPANIQFNMQNPNTRASISPDHVFDLFAQFNFATGEFVPRAISEWELSDGSFTMTIREGQNWDDGDPVTSEDVAVQLRLDKLTGGSLWDYTESIDTPDERTVVLNISGDVNPRIVEFDVLTKYLHQKADIFGEYLETYENGDEDEAARQLQEFAYQDIVTSSTWSLESAGQQELVTTRRDDHPDSENINFDEYAFRFTDGNQEIHQRLINMDLDSVATVFAPPEVVDQMPDAVQLETTPSKWGLGLIPNHRHEQLSDRALRQAIAYVIDRQAVVENVGETLKQAPPLPVGIPSDDQERWLGDSMSDFDDYGVDEAMHEEAATVLEKAGYARENGTWTDENGTPVELPITVPTGWSDWITGTETVVDQLNAFGFQASVDSRSFESLLSTAWPNGDFVLTAGGWLPGGGRAAFAYFSLHHVLVENFRGFTYGYGPAAETRGGSGADVTVPAMSGDGETTVNPQERLQALSQTTDEQLTQEIVREQAWVTNVDLPMIPVMEKLEETFLTTDEWDVPEQGADVSQVHWSNMYLPKIGELTYAGE